jgi:hypothetical protein
MAESTPTKAKAAAPPAAPPPPAAQTAGTLQEATELGYLGTQTDSGDYTVAGVIAAAKDD